MSYTDVDIVSASDYCLKKLIDLIRTTGKKAAEFKFSEALQEWLQENKKLEGKEREEFQNKVREVLEGEIIARGLAEDTTREDLEAEETRYGRMSFAAMYTLYEPLRTQSQKLEEDEV